MVENKKTIGLNAIITILILAGFTIVPGYFDTPKYFCETRPELGPKECDSFSKYIAELGKCIDDDGPNFICKSGWVLVIDDYIFPDEKDYIPNSIGGIGDWICHTPPEHNCVKIEVN